MTQIQQTPFVGQLLQPTQDNADEYLAYCNNICLMIPQDFDELSLLSNKFWRLIRASRVKNFHAAYAALMCLITCKFSRQSDEVQRAIMKRVNELDISSSAHLEPTCPVENNREPPLPDQSAEPRPITTEELQLFRNPDDLLGRRFVLSPDTDDPGIYEVIAYYMKKDKTLQHDVLFDDCGDPITVDMKEMAGMLQDSLYLPAGHEDSDQKAVLS